jgi:hypothetical protein
VLTINAPLRNCGQQSVSTTPQRGVSEMGELTDATRLQLNPADPSPSELVIASSHTIDTISESDLHGNCIFNSHRRPLTQVGRHRVGGVAHQQDRSTAKRGSIDLDEVVQQRWVGVEAINEASCVTGEPGKELLERGEAWRRRFLVYCAGNEVVEVLSDDRGTSPMRTPSPQCSLASSTTTTEVTPRQHLVPDGRNATCGSRV